MSCIQSPAPKNARVCVWNGAVSSHLHDGLRAVEDVMLSIPTGHSPWDVLWLC